MNLISSMTGFGKGESSNDKIKFTVEIKTINNRYNDINIKSPKFIRNFEERVRKSVKNKITRGRIDIGLSYEMLEGNEIVVKPNKSAAISYQNAIQELSQLLNINQEASLQNYLGLPDIFEVSRLDEADDSIWDCLEVAVENAIQELKDMREIEGEELRQDILNNIDKINDFIDHIEKQSSTVVKEYQEKLEKRIADLMTNNYSLDENKLYNEVVFFADRSDINEEIVRLRSHLKQFEFSVKEGGVVGRKLDFILQEINREANTIASKSSKIEITQSAVEIKNHLEKMREQVQNIE
ncbi:MAG: YicC family protein [Tissierellales bacterium]|nr:YicC family protein [Tissierellales bacterium]MBN2827685.1 YicC family protein [Tissierellales bacterium]